MGNTIVLRGGTTAQNVHLAVQKWSKKLFKYSWAEDVMRPFIGKGPNNIVELKSDLLGVAGDKVQFDIFALLTGNGQGDDGLYEANAEAMLSYKMDVVIHERGNSIILNGKMTEKRTIHNLRTQGRHQLGTWLSRKRSADIIAALSGLVAGTFAGQITGAIDVDAASAQIKTVSNGVKVSPTKGANALRWFGGGQSAAGIVESVATDLLINSEALNLFGTAVISHVKRMAEKTVQGPNDTTPGAALSPIMPIMIKGKKHYVMFIDSLQAKQLKNESAWKTAQQSANIRGETNPIFSGAMGIWDGVVIHVSQLLHSRLGAGASALTEEFEADDVLTDTFQVTRALFCGAQAACLAQGQYPSWKEKPLDFDTKMGVHTDVIYGVTKTIFNSIPFGVIIVDTIVIDDVT
jgi:hypothetical protein